MKCLWCLFTRYKLASDAKPPVLILDLPDLAKNGGKKV